MSIELVPLATATFKVEPIIVGPVTGGVRAIGEIVESTWSGERLKGRQVGRAGADWALVSDRGIIQVDVRMTLKTHDDAIVYVQYRGRGRSADGGSVAFVAPIFETSDPRYEWLNSIQAVGRGEMIAEFTMRYEMFETR